MPYGQRGGTAWQRRVRLSAVRLLSRQRVQVYEMGEGGPAAELHVRVEPGTASPGSDLTFFGWPVGRERRGTNAIVRTSGPRHRPFGAQGSGAVHALQPLV